MDLLPIFGRGLLTTAELALLAIVVSAVLGCIIGIGRSLPVASVQFLCRIYIELVRSTPIPVLLVFIFFALPDVGIKLSPFVSATVGLSIYMAAYVAEAVRSGINAVPTSYIEAGRALGLPEHLVISHILLPQAIRAVIPTLGNLAVDLIKDTSIAYTIAVI